MIIEELDSLANDTQISLDAKQAQLDAERAAKNALLAQKDANIATLTTVNGELKAEIEVLKNTNVDVVKLQEIFGKFVAIKKDLEETPVEVEETEPTEEEPIEEEV